MILRLAFILAALFVTNFAISDEFESIEWPYERATEVIESFLPDMILAGEVIVTFRSSLGTEPEEIVLIQSENDGELVAEFIRAGGKGYALQLRKALEENPDLASGTDYPEIEYLRWQLGSSSCSMLMSEVANLVSAVEVDASEFRRTLTGEEPDSEASSGTLMIRADGPIHTVRMMPHRTSWVSGSEIEIRPGPETRIEIAVESLLHEIDVCTQRIPGQSLRR